MSSPSTITFGPPSHPWTYTPQTKIYNLSPSTSPSKTLTFRTTHGPPETSIQISPSKTALVIVDMQNFFLDSSCMSHPTGLKAVEPTIRVIKKCRELGIKIIWLNWGLTDQDLSTMPASIHRGFMKSVLLAPSSSHNPSYTGLGSDLGGTKGRCLFAGSWNAEIYPPLAAHALPTDLYCAKNRMSGLWHADTELSKVLGREEIETVFWMGVNTDQCVLGSLVDAYQRGWGCVCVDDCCGTNTVGGREVSLGNIAGAYGFVTDSAAILNARVSE